MESGILGPGILNTAQGIWNPTKDWNPVPLTKTGIQCLESGIHGVESRYQDCNEFPYTGQKSYNIDEKPQLLCKQYPILVKSN